jgi:hypothetical protein
LKPLLKKVTTVEKGDPRSGLKNVMITSSAT